MDRIPVIDLFAGPGGLGEGFSACRVNGTAPFRVALSIEKDAAAHATLELRAFFRQFPPGEAPEDYYRHVRDPHGFPRAELFARWPEESERARQEAWLAELGVTDNTDVDKRVRTALGNSDAWVLVGGPPCQAYSLVGRSRRRGIQEDDPRVYLYKQYLRILAVHRPPVFVMENVKGLLSSRLGDSQIFTRMVQDLARPGAALSMADGRSSVAYEIYSMTNRQKANTHSPVPSDFLIPCENYGVPQARHRVILLGVRSDAAFSDVFALIRSDQINAASVLSDLPPLRSGLSKQHDSGQDWKQEIQRALDGSWLRELRQSNSELAEKIESTLKRVTALRNGRGGEFLETNCRATYRSDWYADPRLCGVLNHSTRGHIAKDLHRYLFAATFAQKYGRSPNLGDYPSSLLPEHLNVTKALSGGHFADRFRVQLASRPATTITSHISKDGHYYIHYDPLQCRSLTVREAARLQTFPDNYFFCGPRTQQYHQVGNAVPPLLACQIAQGVYQLLKGASDDGSDHQGAPKLEYVENSEPRHDSGARRALVASP